MIVKTAWRCFKLLRIRMANWDGGFGDGDPFGPYLMVVHSANMEKRKEPPAAGAGGRVKFVDVMGEGV